MHLLRISVVDWDGDGNDEVLASETSEYGNILLVELDGGVPSVAWTIGTSRFAVSYPAPVDWDEDGDLDLLLPYSCGPGQNGGLGWFDGSAEQSLADSWCSMPIRTAISIC